MNHYTISSETKLMTCHKDLQTIFRAVLQNYDHTIIYGVRSKEEQDSLFSQGRKFLDGKWVTVDRNKIVTEKFWPNSRHNIKSPGELSMAVDAAPYIDRRMVDGSRRGDIDQIYHFVGYVKGVADTLRNEGRISHRLRCGADWDSDKNIHDQTFNDLFHFELIY